MKMLKMKSILIVALSTLIGSSCLVGHREFERIAEGDRILPII